jgi:hypothetical protein
MKGGPTRASGPERILGPWVQLQKLFFGSGVVTIQACEVLRPKQDGNRASQKPLLVVALLRSLPIGRLPVFHEAFVGAWMHWKKK